MKISFFVFILVPLLFCMSSCDDRDGAKPDIDVVIENHILYSDGASCNLNYTDITFILDGSSGLISNAKILVEYDTEKGTFLGTGSSQHIITDKNGIAVGRFITKDGASGVVGFEAKMDRFKSVRMVQPIYIYKLPQITQFYSETNTVSANGSTTIYAVLRDHTGNSPVPNTKIRFTTTRGLIDSEFVTTNEQGIAQNIFCGANQSGTAVITAALGICPNRYRNLTIVVE